VEGRQRQAVAATWLPFAALGGAWELHLPQRWEETASQPAEAAL